MSFYRRVANLFSRSKVEQEIDAELRSHIEMRIDDNIAAGIPPEEARRDAMIRFGNPAVMKERVSAADTEVVLDGIWRDIRYAARQLRHSPGFAITAILTLALAIAANIVVFSVLNALILKPLNVAGSDRLFSVVQKPHGYNNQSWPDFVDYRRLNTTFSDMAAYRMLDVGLSSAPSARKCWMYEVSGNYFDMLGVQPALGRFFHARDEHGPDSAPYIVLSDAFWRARFNGDPRVIGSVVDVNKHPFTITGIAPRDFHGTELIFWPDLWMPILNEQQIEGFDFLKNRGSHGSWIIGELKPGVRVQEATQNLNSIAARLGKQYPITDDDMGARLVRPGLMGDTLNEPTRAFLAAIMLLAFLVLLAACANLASIFGARAADRGRELAVRLAIGSSRWHILRQLLTEAILISLAGGLGGTLFATALLKALSSWQPFPEFPIHVTVTPDVRVYALAVMLSIASGLLPGLLPARQVWQTDLLQAMKSNAPGVTILKRVALRDFLLGLQIALCALLLTASLVALRGMERSLHAPFGFQPAGVMLAETDMHMAGYSDESALRAQKRMLEGAARMPGVIAAGTINETPLGTGGSTTSVFREGTTDFRSSNTTLGAKYYSISPGYLHAAGTRLLAGRDVSWHDDAKAPKIALVNETFARILFGTTSAVGRHFLMTNKSRYEVAGVLEDGKYDSLTEAPTAAMFFPLAQSPDSDTALVVRSQLPPSELAPALNRMLSGIDPNLPFTIHTWPNALSLVLFPARAATASLGVMGLLAAMLAVTGVFGIAAYSISKRMKELGIRIALGAQRMQLMRSALARPLVFLLCGSMAGLLAGVVASRVLAQIVYETTPRDPLVLSGVILTMLLIGILATWIPARRALKIDPATLLKDA
jgi:predicted permease